MQAVILCGGRGTRLREETEFRPKPLVEIGGMPILWHIMKIYSHYGVKDFILCLGYKGHMIKEFFMDLEIYGKDITYNPKTKKIIHHNGSDGEDWNITFAETGLDTYTGARIKRIEKYITGDDFFLTYGDGVADINIKELYEFHKKHGKIATVTAVQPFARFGVLNIDNELISDFTKKHVVHTNRIDGGFFVFTKKVFDYLSNDRKCALEDQPLKNLVKDNQFVAFRHDGFWQCMDIQQHAEGLNELWNSGEAPWKIWQ
ncbi:MAG TPA: glucose-1-phosphate cytidylyltransferase [Candidatus Nanoarchaeia archaeon]|nr:glucose-1-phosphate cytidylyltransferase [Candidatus Nanoarchaeia archaeon]